MTDDVATPTPGTPGPPTRTERLDELPFTRKHGRLLVGSGLGWALDALDVGLLSFVIAQLAVVWSSDKGALAFVASAGFAGMAIGAAVGGSLSDRLGRKTVFALTLLVYGLATGLSALSWSVGALLVLRFVVGLGLGAELPVASTLVSEFSPRRIRGRVVVLLEAFWALGSIAAALVGWLVVPLSDDGWRWALLIGALPALYAVFVRLRMPESVRFLEARGRHDEAERTVRAFEEAAGIARPAAAPRAAVDTRSAVPSPVGPSSTDAHPAGPSPTGPSSWWSADAVSRPTSLPSSSTAVPGAGAKRLTGPAKATAVGSFRSSSCRRRNWPGTMVSSGRYFCATWRSRSGSFSRAHSAFSTCVRSRACSVRRCRSRNSRSRCRAASSARYTFHPTTQKAVMAMTVRGRNMVPPQSSR